MLCPLCNTELPTGASSCTRCDWVQTSALPPTRRDDWMAAVLSIVPGLGHLYKGHLLPGLVVLCLLGPAYLVMIFLLIPVTFGLSLTLPAFFVVLTGAHAFRLPNVRKDPGILEHARRTAERWLRARPGRNQQH